MDSYHKRKKVPEEKHCKLMILRPFNDDNGIADNKQQKYIKQIADISDEEGLKLAHGSKDGLYQHNNNYI